MLTSPSQRPLAPLPYAPRPRALPPIRPFLSTQDFDAHLAEWTKHMRDNQDAARCEQLLEELRDSYRALCGSYQTAKAVAEFQRWNDQSQLEREQRLETARGEFEREYELFQQEKARFLASDMTAAEQARIDKYN
mgnify:CR=1 FL=1